MSNGNVLLQLTVGCRTRPRTWTPTEHSSFCLSLRPSHCLQTVPETGHREKARAAGPGSSACPDMDSLEATDPSINWTASCPYPCLCTTINFQEPPLNPGMVHAEPTVCSTQTDPRRSVSAQPLAGQMKQCGCGKSRAEAACGTAGRSPLGPSTSPGHIPFPASCCCEP